jgi:predicted AlkP superfamily pyrophosphatase or phosphodiesterase
MHKTVVINAVGLTPALIGRHTPRLSAFLTKSALASIGPVLPAVTTTVQSTYLTGTFPDQHGIVANGWYFRDECEIKFWRQSNHLVQRPKIWDHARQLNPKFTCANLFWWYNMYSSADFSVTPRPMYPADGRKIPDIHTNPPTLRHDLQRQLGQFPLFKFWGPATSIDSTRWIADASILVDRQFDPTLTLIYLPHLDYCLQRLGNSPDAIATDLADLDRIIAYLLDHYESRRSRILILSEYGVTPVSHPVHLNRILRQAGLLAVREELGRELLDPGASRAFAVADHQVAHIYVNQPASMSQVRKLLESTPGVAQILDEQSKTQWRLNHPRSGELIALAKPDSWFTYYYWLNNPRMPDFARTVDIHRKPGYDPAELFLDPNLLSPKLKIAWTLLKRKLGFRSLLEVIPTSADLVRGSHGLPAPTPDRGPMVMTNQADLLPADSIGPTELFKLIISHLTLPC